MSTEFESESVFTRRTVLRAAGLSVAALGMGTYLAACSRGEGVVAENGSTSQLQGAPTTLTLGIDATKAIFDPTFYTSLGDWMVVDSVCRGLTKMDFESSEVRPDLAEWEVSDDGLEYVFTLRQGVGLHDGNELTTKDVIRSLERQWNPDDPTLVEGASRPLAAAGLNVEKMKASDDYTIRFTLKDPDLTFPARLSDIGGRILSAEAIEQLGKDIGKAPVGSGPFKFASAVSGQRVILESFDDYIDGAPSIDRLVFLQIQDQATIVSALRSGEISATQFAPYSTLEQLSQDPELQSFETPFGADAIMMMDMRKPALKELQVRQAINLAIDRRALVERAFHNAAVLPRGYLIPPPQPCYDEKLSELTERNIEKARSLISEVGAEGRQVRLIAASDSWHPTAMQIIEENLKEVGLSVVTETVEPSAFFSRVTDGNDDRDLMIWERNSYVPDPDNMVGAVASPDSIYGGLISGWTDAGPADVADEIRQRLKEARRVTDNAERTRIYSDVQTRYATEVAGVAPLAAFTNPVIARSDVLGLDSAALSTHRCLMEEAELTQ